LVGEGVLSPADPPLGWATGARAGSACVPAWRPGLPLLARARLRCGAVVRGWLGRQGGVCEER
jgi:hypothetical protein